LMVMIGVRTPPEVTLACWRMTRRFYRNPARMRTRNFID
jgi:hypothetical protein